VRDCSSAPPPARCGASDVALKYLTQAAPGPLLGLLSPWALTAVIAGVIAFYASARSLQIGDGVEVIALTSVTANLTAIIGGILVFYEPIGSGALEVTARFLAFCLVIAGAAAMPAPMRVVRGALGRLVAFSLRRRRSCACRPSALSRSSPRFARRPASCSANRRSPPAPRARRRCSGGRVAWATDRCGRWRTADTSRARWSTS